MTTLANRSKTFHAKSQRPRGSGLGEELEEALGFQKAQSALKAEFDALEVAYKHAKEEAAAKNKLVAEAMAMACDRATMHTTVGMRVQDHIRLHGVCSLDSAPTKRASNGYQNEGKAGQK